MRRCLVWASAMLIAACALLTQAAELKGAPDSLAKVLLPNRSPLVTFRILFMVGSAFDPKDQAGAAALTAALLAEGGTRTLSYDQILEKMYPLATSFSWQVDKEMTVFSGTTHLDNLEAYYALIRAQLLEPGFRRDDFDRLKANALNFLKVSLREGNDEELGKEQLYNLIYAGHSYGHHNLGTVSALEKLTLADARAFYQRHYTRANLVLGLAGGYPLDFLAKVKSDLAKLPKGHKNKTRFAAPSLKAGPQMQIIRRETRSTAISLGFPIHVTRQHWDWPALALIASYFGQHRSSNSHLFQRLREARGLNYGDYAYLEYFPRGMYQFVPDPNLARQSQIFQIWIRPVQPEHGHFALRAALYEYDKLLRDGLRPLEFEATRNFLSKFVSILSQSQDAQLGYALDSHYYGIGPFTTFLRERLAKLSLDEVNHVLRKHLRTDRMRMVVVTKEAEALRDAILENVPSPIHYNAPKPKEITEEDALIAHYRLGLQAQRLLILPVAETFQ